MAGRPISEWDVLNRFLALVIGSHRGSWALGGARQAAFDGIWDEIVTRTVEAEVRVMTDSNMHTSCVYEVGADGDSLLLSTVLPFSTVWSRCENRYLDDPPSWAERFQDLGFAHLGERAARTLSPYHDDEADRRLTYAELLFEWTEGSDGPPEHALFDPWNPATHKD